MPNEHLKHALRQAGLTVEEFAAIITVDPKTVQRWVAGRAPYPRHRATIAHALDIPEHELWPDAAPAPATTTETDQPTLGGEVTETWGRASDADARNALMLLAHPTERIDVLDYHGTLLEGPGVPGALKERAFDGTEVRVLVGTTPQHAGLTGQEGIELRIVSSSSSLALLRAGDTMLVALLLNATGEPALLALRHVNDTGVFARLADHFNSLWAKAEIPRHPPALITPPPGGAARFSGPPATDEPTHPQSPEPTSPSPQSAPRGWPRRPT